MKRSEWMRGLLACECFIKNQGAIQAGIYLDRDLYNADSAFQNGWYDCIIHYLFLEGEDL